MLHQPGAVKIAAAAPGGSSFFFPVCSSRGFSSGNRVRVFPGVTARLHYIFHKNDVGNSYKNKRRVRGVSARMLHGWLGVKTALLSISTIFQGEVCRRVQMSG